MLQIDDELAYVLHTMPYRGSSLICEVFTKNHGKMKLLALSARGPKSRFRGVFRTFNLLRISARGKSELRKVSQATCENSIIELQSIPLFCGYYIHELLRYCLAIEDPAPELFAIYEQTIASLMSTTTDNLEIVLRQFEKILLEHCGYGIDFEKDAFSDEPISSTAQYQFILGEGFVAKNGLSALIPGKVLLNIAKNEWHDSDTKKYAKFIFRQAIHECLQGRDLMSRQLLKSFI